ncbi:MAG: AAA family ATPase [Fimbriimonas sp.]
MPSPQTFEILKKLSEQLPADNARAQNVAAALQTSLEKDAADAQEKDKLLTEYEQAYNKLTAPANRLAIFLNWVDSPEGGQLALIAMGDQEFVVEVDPNLNLDLLGTGTRVRVNEAYAIVGVLAQSPSGGVSRVAEALADGRLRLGNDTPGSEGRLILRGEKLKDTTIRAGDEVRLDGSGRIALEHYEKQESRDYFLEDVPEIPWEKVGGQEKAIQLIRDTIETPLLHPEIFAAYEKKPIKGILLYGPPGCGKTLIGKATAYNLTREYSQRTGKEVKEYFMAISGPKILNMWLGETERMVREIFKTAREKAKEGRLVFIFMDEAESVLRTRSSGRYMNISNTVVPQFCAELDGLQSLENVVLMLTSNRPDYIDPAVLRPERIDRKVKVTRPDHKSATDILGIYLHSRLPLDPDVVAKFHGDADCARKELVEGTIDALWRTTKENRFLKVAYRDGSSETLFFKDMISGALIKSIVDRAKDSAIKRAIADPDKVTGIMMEDLQEAMVQEYRENEIFPKSDTMEDWLQLLDVAPENVASVKPLGTGKGEDFVRRNVI